MHTMQTRYAMTVSVRPSVRLSARHTSKRVIKVCSSHHSSFLTTNITAKFRLVHLHLGR